MVRWGDIRRVTVKASPQNRHNSDIPCRKLRRTCGLLFNPIFSK
jgi:hypothetical protein